MIELFTAERPQGPYQKHPANPVLKGDIGAWDSGGYSEGCVLYHDGVFHMFYSGSETHKIEDIGYAYSFDGINFIKHLSNPIGQREKNPDAAAFAEVQALWEPPFYYVYHTLRYRSHGGWSDLTGKTGSKNRMVEDLGV